MYIVTGFVCVKPRKWYIYAPLLCFVCVLAYPDMAEILLDLALNTNQSLFKFEYTLDTVINRDSEITLNRCSAVLTTFIYIIG
jgi:hypothetical protein